MAEWHTPKCTHESKSQLDSHILQKSVQAPHRASHLQVVVFGCSDRTTSHQMLSMILMNHETTQTKFDCVQIGERAIGAPQTPLGRKVRLCDTLCEQS